MIPYLATPAILLPNMNNEEWEEECLLMISRSVLTSDFANGKISWEEFLDGLNTYGIPDPRILEESWEQGLVYF